jgi:hypothetical protein
MVVLALGALATTAGVAGQLAPLKFELPIPIPGGTPEDIKPHPYLEPPLPLTYRRPAFLAPEGTRLLSFEKPVTGSDDDPVVGDLDMVTDGEKKGTDGTYVELGPMRQWVQVDLEQPYELHAILVWHFHKEKRVYHDVVVQVADDSDFITNVRTVFNNDFDNSSGLGLGKDKEYHECHRGRLIPVKGLKARYVRLYSKGSTASDLNHYVEVEVWGK